MGLFKRKAKKNEKAVIQSSSVDTNVETVSRGSFQRVDDYDYLGVPTLHYDPYALHIEEIDELTDGYQFEEMAATILKHNGFTNIKVTKRSKDFGIDVVAEKQGIKYAIQCKKYTNRVGVDAIREAAMGKTFYNCHVAAVMTNNYFTAQARTLAQKGGVVLWDRDELIKMIQRVKK